MRLDRSCCLVACFFSGRSAELSGTSTSPYAFVYFRLCRQSRVRHWPRYNSYRLAVAGILLCSFVHLSQCILLAYVGSLAVGGRLGSTCRWIAHLPCRGWGELLCTSAIYQYMFLWGSSVSRLSCQHISQGTASLVSLCLFW